MQTYRIKNDILRHYLLANTFPLKLWHQKYDYFMITGLVNWIGKNNLTKTISENRHFV